MSVRRRGGPALQDRQSNDNTAPSGKLVQDVSETGNHVLSLTTRVEEKTVLLRVGALLVCAVIVLIATLGCNRKNDTISSRPVGQLHIVTLRFNDSDYLLLTNQGKENVCMPSDPIFFAHAVDPKQFTGERPGIVRLQEFVILRQGCGLVVPAGNTRYIEMKDCYGTEVELLASKSKAVMWLSETVDLTEAP